LTYIQFEYTLNDHVLDFVDPRQIFDGATFTLEDDRFRYDERRWVTLGVLEGIPVPMVHTETKDRIHVISFERQQSVKRRSSSKTSKTDWVRVRGMKNKDIKRTAEHPEADVKHIVRGIARQGLKRGSGKTSISLRVDAEVLEWFKAQGPGYQTRINAVLKAFKDASG
jgi:uncharacterized protein (DUF4415 family)